MIAVLASAAAMMTAAPAGAQAWHYPAFQTPTIASREFNFAVAGGGDYGTTGLAQWREGIGPDTHLAFDLGFASPSGSTFFLIGGGIGQRLFRATQETPIDLTLTGGIYGAFSSDFSVVRLPVGVVVGHRFPLSGGLALTPYAHPRLSVDVCASSCHGTGTDLKVNFDIGADFEVSRQLSLRSALTVGGVSDGPSKVGVGFGIAFRPQTLSRR
jgi:hypothetical protein